MSFWDVFFEDGNVNTWIAPPKKGKTNAMADMGDNLIEYGKTILGNIMFFKEKNIPKAIANGWLNPDIDYRPQPEKFKYLPTASELLLASTTQDDNVVVVDEASISASSYKAMSDPSTQFRFLGFTIRKIGSCLNVITQAKSAIVPTLREHLTTFEVHVKRMPSGRRDLDILKAHHFFNDDKGDYDIRMDPYDYIRNVPQACIAYDTRHPGGFEWDLDLKELYDTIARRRIDSTEIREELPAIIRDLVADRKIDIIMNKKMFMQTGRVAQIFDVTTQTVRDWAEAGILKGEKNEKGHWFFPIKDVKKKAIEEGFL